MPRNATRFVNPYTFVPLGMSLEDRLKENWHREAPLDGGEKLMGAIHCELTPRTALSIPDTSDKELNKRQEDKTEEDRTFAFFRIKDGGKPVIPGSSIRGPIRSVFEALTDSCLPSSNIQLHSVSKAKKPGLLFKEDGKYVLYRAERYRVKDDAVKSACSGLKTGELRRGMRTGETTGKFKTKTVESLSGGATAGYYLRMNELNGSTPNFFERGPRVTTWDERYFKTLEENVAAYRENADELPEKDPAQKAKKAEAKDRSNDYHRQLRALKGDDTGEVALPVWFEEENGAFHLAPAQISRTMYVKTTHDFLGNLSHKRCTESGRPCPACNLFGFVSQSGEDSSCKAGKVRFTDATLKDGSEYRTEYVFLPDLMEPRVSSLEFYMKPSERRHNIAFTPDTPGADIAGRKFYWHHQDGHRAADGFASYNSKMEIVKACEKTVFEFDVFFDGISKLQLNQLVYALSLGQAWGECGSKLCHKIGHGKPVGLGSVYVEVKSVTCRPRPDSHAYSLISGDGWKLGGREEVEGTLSAAALEPVKAVTRFDAIGSDREIDYPRTEPGGDIFEWFSENRQPAASGKYVELLPDPTAQTQDLPRNPNWRDYQDDRRQNQNPPQGRMPRGPRSGSSGTVKFFNAEKNYGFIIRDDGEGDLFFLGYDVVAGLSDLDRKGGDRVTFTFGKNKKGLCAKNVRLDR